MNSGHPTTRNLNGLLSLWVSSDDGHAVLSRDVDAEFFSSRSQDTLQIE